MAPIFIRVELCPTFHQTSPLPTSGSLARRTVPVNIEPCKSHSDLIFHLIDAMRTHCLDIDFQTELLEGAKVLCHSRKHSCDHANVLLLDDLKYDYRCVGGEDWKFSFMSRVVRVHIGSNKGPWFKPKPAKSLNGNAEKKKNSKGDRITLPKAARDSGSESDEDDDVDDVPRECYFFVRSCDNFHAGGDINLPLQRIAVRRPFDPNGKLILRSMVNQLDGVSGLPENTKGWNVRFHQASDRDCETVFNVQELLEACKFDTKTPSFDSARLRKKQLLIDYIPPPTDGAGQSKSEAPQANGGAAAAKGGKASGKEPVGSKSSPTYIESDKDDDEDEDSDGEDRRRKKGERGNRNEGGAVKVGLPRYMLYEMCSNQHDVPAGLPKKHWLRIDPPHCNNLQDVCKAIAVKWRNLGFAYDAQRYQAVFHGISRGCADPEDFSSLLQNYAFPTYLPPKSEKDKRIVQVHLEGSPELLGKKAKTNAQALGASSQRRTSGGTTSNGIPENEEEDVQPPESLVNNGGNGGGEEDAQPPEPLAANDDVDENHRQSTQPAAKKKRKRKTYDPRAPSTRPKKALPNGYDEGSPLKKRKVEKPPPLHPREENDGRFDEDEEYGDGLPEDANDEGTNCRNEAEDQSARELHRIAVKALDNRRYVRVGKLNTPEEFRRPKVETGQDADVLAMRQIIVAFVPDDTTHTYEVEFKAIDSWNIMGHRVGDYPSGDPWTPYWPTGPQLIPDPYWRTAYEAERLADAVIVYASENNGAQVADNDSDLSDFASMDDAEQSTVERPEAPGVPIAAPLQPHHTNVSIVAHYGRDDWEEAQFDEGERIDAVVCFANALASVQFNTYRNFQISLPHHQKLDTFRSFVKNVPLKKNGRTLKHILRERLFKWWGDFQVWIMPVHDGGQVDEVAFLWDEPSHRSCTIGQFVHNQDKQRRGKAQLFIEIRVTKDPQYKRKETVWKEHRGYAKGRTKWYGWKEKTKDNGHCMLDDQEDKGQIRDDKKANTLPPRGELFS